MFSKITLRWSPEFTVAGVVSFFAIMIILIVVQCFTVLTRPQKPKSIQEVAIHKDTPAAPSTKAPDLLTAEDARQLHRDIELNAGKLVPENVKQKVFSMIRAYSAQGMEEVKFDDTDLELSWGQYVKVREPLKLYLEQLGYDVSETLISAVQVSWKQKPASDIPPPLPKP